MTAKHTLQRYRYRSLFPSLAKGRPGRKHAARRTLAIEPLESRTLLSATGWQGLEATSARNVIVMIGDGMGPEHVDAARMFLGGDIIFDHAEYQAEMTTYSANSAVTDSAASGTAMATGQKVNNGTIGSAIPGDGDELASSLEILQARGKATGLVTTAQITHATPAAFGAHAESRGDYEEIAVDLLTQTRPNVLFGGGGFGMSVDAAMDAGYTVVTDTAGLLALDADTWSYVSGQFGTSHMPFEYDGVGNLPHLSQMTDVALDLLDDDPDGFFLMVEGGRIDHAGHGNDIERNVRETVEFANTVETVLAWAAGRTDTLVIVTADHETGGMSIVTDNGAGQAPEVTWSTNGHTATNVPVYAWGNGADAVNGVLDNTDIFNLSVVEAIIDPIDSFTIAVLPDTQRYAESFPDRFMDQTQWIADHVASENIVFVTHVGDVVQNGGEGADLNAIEWARADAAMDLLDGDLETSPDGLVPYSVTLGNHDYDVISEHGSADQFISNFGADRYAGRSWYGGSSADQFNQYQVFRAGDYEFLHLTLQWEPLDADIAWAQSVIDAHPDLPVILSTHAYLFNPAERYTKTRTEGGNSGEQLFEKLVRPNSQIFMVVGGHDLGEVHQVSTNVAGLKVIEVLANYQARPNGGDGFLQLFKFLPDENRIDVVTYSPTLDTFETDADSQFSIVLDFAARFGPADAVVEQPEATDLGRITLVELDGLDLTAGELWYRAKTTRRGLLTAEATAVDGAAQMEMTLYDANLRELASASYGGPLERIDYQVDAATTYYVKLTGTSAQTDLRLANLVEMTPGGSEVVVHGTEQDDSFDVFAGARHLVLIDGLQYEFDATTTVHLDGHGGEDRITINGTNGDESATLRPGGGTVTGSGYELQLARIESITLHGGGGRDEAVLHDSAGDDLLAAFPGMAHLSGDGFSLKVVDFDLVETIASEGIDVAKLYDSPGDDDLLAMPTYARIKGDGFYNRVRNFDGVHAYATAGGVDVAKLYDSADDDLLFASPTEAALYGDGFYNRAKFFEGVHAYATAGGDDRAELLDSTGDDTFYATPTAGALYGDGFYNRAKFFEHVEARSVNGGEDVALLFDSPGNDELLATPTYAGFSGEGFHHEARSFAAVSAYATAGGIDVAKLFDSPGDDTFLATPDFGQLSGGGFSIRAEAFDGVHAYATAGGLDTAEMFDSGGDDNFYASSTAAAMSGPGFYNRAKYFEQVHARADADGLDTAYLYDALLDKDSDKEDREQIDLGPDTAKIVWIYKFERLFTATESSDEAPVQRAVDEVLTAHWV
ncbi:MAG: alkaline phosphatase [Thermoguttaceae bacterium]